MQQDATKREFRLRIPFYWWIGLPILPAIGPGFWTVVTVANVWSCYGMTRTPLSSISASQLQHFHELTLSLALLAAFFATVTVCMTCWVVRTILEAIRGSIEIGPCKIRVIDWRRRTKDIRWCEIRQLTITSCGGVCRPPRIAMIANDQVIKLSAWLQDREILTEEIVYRAGLARAFSNWFRTYYRSNASPLVSPCITTGPRR